MSNPSVNPAILISPVEGGYVAYDPVADKLHQLNPLAALITELCDGNRSTSEIRELVTPLVSEGKANEIEQWIDQATKAGLLVMDGVSAGHRELTGPELYKMALRLRDYGKAQPTYLCLKRAVDLNPEDWDSWYYLGDACLSLGRREEGRVAYQKYFGKHPEDAEIEHLLVALRDEAPPARAPDRTIQCIYKDFADHYDTLMRDDLDYQGPERMMDAIKPVIGEPQGTMNVLDLGCGSGFSGMAFKPYASHLIGLDLSPEMLDLAKKRGVYDDLQVAEITDWLDKSKDKFDLIVSCDCLIYFGDLHRIVAATAAKLKPGGHFGMSMERGDRYPFRLTDTGRYAHHADHVRDAAAAAGLTVTRLQEAFLRNEYGTPVMGLYAVLEKPRS